MVNRMNRTTAIALLLIGVLLFLGSCAPIGYVIYHEVVIEPSERVSLSEPDTSDEFTFQASPGTLARFTIKVDVTTSSVQEDPDSFSDEYIARFKFPISYTIMDASGNTLIYEDITLAWKDGGSVSKSNEETTSTGGTLTASTSLKKFTVPVDGSFKLSIMISPDTTYEASYASPQLNLYEGMIDNTWYIVSGVFMFFVGFIMAMVGFIFAITNATQVSLEQQVHESSASTGTSSNVGQRDKDINQQAMFIQLSAFAGYIIPLGSLIVPLILWQVWKQKDPYIDEMGREAVNFQLSMLLYYIICFVLFFVLIGMLLIFAAVIFHITFIIIGAVQTSRGANYRYPMIIRFIKD